MTSREFFEILANRFTNVEWTEDRLDELQHVLNMNRMQIVSGAIGHLRLLSRTGRKTSELD